MIFSKQIPLHINGSKKTNWKYHIDAWKLINKNDNKGKNNKYKYFFFLIYNSKQSISNNKNKYEITCGLNTIKSVIKTKVKQINWGYEDGYTTVARKTPLDTTPISDDVEIELYPYGCSKLRMTEIPKIEE